MYLSKISFQGKTDAAYSADSICVNYTNDGQVPVSNSPCIVSVTLLKDLNNYAKCLGKRWKAFDDSHEKKFRVDRRKSPRTHESFQRPER